MAADKMNVLYVSHESGLNGAPRSLVGMINSLREYVNPLVIIPEKGDLEQLLVEHDINYHIVHFKNGHHSIGYYNRTEFDEVYSDNMIATDILMDIIRNSHIHIIHSNSSVVDVGAIAAVKAGLPHIWHLREFCEEDFGIEYINKEWKKLLFSYSNFFAISQSVRDVYLTKYGLLSEWAFDCMDNIDLAPLDNRFEQNVIDLLIAGTISPGKGQMDAVRAIHALVGRNIRNIRLILVGHGAKGYLWSIRKFIEANNIQQYIKILPYSNDLTRIRRRCAISLTCSKLEGLGRVTIEAMLDGVVVIGANTGGTKELIGEDQERGYLYQQGDFKDLADKIELVMNDIEVRDVKRVNAQRFIVEQTDPGNYADKIMLAYYKCINTLPHSEKNRDGIIKYIEKHPHTLSVETVVQQVNAGNTAPNKFRSMFMLAEKWLRIGQKGRKIVEYIRNHGFHTVAIYGFGALGSILFDDLNGSHITISYIIDRAPMDLGDWIIKLTPDDDLPKVDLIIVTVVNDYENIYKNLSSRYPYAIMNLADILEELLLQDEKEWSTLDWDN